MLFINDGKQVILIAWPIVKNTVLEAAQLFDTVHKLLRIHKDQFSFGQQIGCRRFRTISSIRHQAREVLHLIQLSVFAGFQNIVSHICISLFIYLGICQQFFEESHGSRHIFVEAGEYNISTFATRRYKE